MREIAFSNLSSKLSTWINGDEKPGDKYFRHVLDVSGNGKNMRIIYSISYSKTHSDDDQGKVSLVKGLKSTVKLLTGIPLLTPSVEPTSDTYCFLDVDILYVRDGYVKLKYDISISNGSFVHKKMVKYEESLGLFRHLSHIDGITIEEPFITINVGTLNQGAHIKDLIFNGNSRTLVIY